MQDNELLAIKRINGKTAWDIQTEWDRIASKRHRQIASGADVSFSHVLLPIFEELMGNCELESVLDLGCGTGELTKVVASLSKLVTGIDPSPESVAIARKMCADCLNVSFYVSTAEEFADRRSEGRFTTAVSNMVLMDCLNLDSVLSAAASVLDVNASFIATITHPWFWPQYWAYADAPWFIYQNETILEATFRISGEVTDCVTTHVHRPLSQYLKSFSRAGFRVNQILEPFPCEEVHRLYAEQWKYPRFMVFVASKAAGTEFSDAQIARSFH